MSFRIFSCSLFFRIVADASTGCMQQPSLSVLLGVLPHVLSFVLQLLLPRLVLRLLVPRFLRSPHPRQQSGHPPSGELRRGDLGAHPRQRSGQTRARKTSKHGFHVQEKRVLTRLLRRNKPGNRLHSNHFAGSLVLQPIWRSKPKEFLKRFLNLL